MWTSDDDDGLRSEVGQTLALFGMSLAVVFGGAARRVASLSPSSIRELGRKDSNLD
jgi:hypothetical protein